VLQLRNHRSRVRAGRRLEPQTVRWSHRSRRRGVPDRTGRGSRQRLVELPDRGSARLAANDYLACLRNQAYQDAADTADDWIESRQQ